jgi:hypothetical protein
VHNGLGYVFGNYTHHGEWSYGDGVLDLHSSGWRFDGWSRPPLRLPESQSWRWPRLRCADLAPAKRLLEARPTRAPPRPSQVLELLRRDRPARREPGLRPGPVVCNRALGLGRPEFGLPRVAARRLLATRHCVFCPSAS